MAVNALMSVVLLSLASTGLVLHYTLPPGSGHQAAGGRFGIGRPVEKLLGMTRHEWGQIHFVIALIFLSLLLIHLILHWNWLYCIAWGTKANPQPFWRRAVTLLILSYIFGVFALPFVK